MAFFVFILYSFALHSNATHADAALQARQAIQAVYHIRHISVEQRNTNVLMAYLTPDWIGIDEKGHTRNYVEERGDLNNLFAMAKTAKTLLSNAVIQKFKLEGNQAVLTSNYQMHITYIDPRTRQLAKYDQIDVCEEIWVLKSNKWLMKQQKILTDKQLINGVKIASPT